MRGILPIINVKNLSKVNFVNVCNMLNTMIYPLLIRILTVH